MLGRFRSLSRAPVAKILFGSVLGQGAVLAASPVLTRLYSPDHFSAFASLTAIAAILGGLATLSWERATVVPRQEETARTLLTLGLLSALVVSSILALISFAARDWLADVTGVPLFAVYWWLVPVTVCFIAVFGIMSSWLVRGQDYTGLAVRNGVQGISQALSGVILGVVGVVPLGLLLSTAVGRAAALLGVSRRLRRDGGERVTLRQIGSTAATYRRFPLVNTWSRLANALGVHLPIVLIVSFYGSIEVGLFALTVRVLAAPVGMIIDATAQWFEGAFAMQFREGSGKLRPFITKSAWRLLAVGLGPSLLLAVTGPAVFDLVFGSTWREAGVFAQIVVASYLAQFCVAPVSRALVILGWQVTQLVWDVTRALATLGTIVAAATLELSLTGCLVALTCAQVASYLVLFLLCVNAAGRADQPSQVVSS
ncbi:oligosaccharide flippase family protein [Georgenia phoenicis]|uniref:lipopolysaccharide biosynthesis protein n=1 Tax=unclassified Georgenia TaxID=2626815 RepID=UPI0039AEFF06